ncbi:hypothetical protein ACFV2S_25145 [Streptomyces sp. NPDC059695]|uniref:hypothetical protein n=1 Tax=Streptomyces sp. NPDC059695 TaxID=3346910 RepID=UPI0036A741C1
MSKQVVTVCLPPCEPHEVREALAAAMAPFAYDAQFGKPDEEWQGEWDYWLVDAYGWDFTVRPGHEDDPRIVRDADARPRPRSLCDGGPKGLLDLDTGRAVAAREAGERWDAWRVFAAGFPPSLPYAHFARRAAEDPGCTQDRVVADFGAQPVIRALDQDPSLEERFTWDPVAWFGEDRAAFVARAEADVLPSFALLTLDGVWLDGSSHQANVRFNAYVDGLPDSTLLVRVMYHS